MLESAVRCGGNGLFHMPHMLHDATHCAPLVCGMLIPFSRVWVPSVCVFPLCGFSLSLFCIYLLGSQACIW